MIVLMVRWILAIGIAYVAGKLVSKIKLPAILGWLITGMILGPHAVALVSNTLIDMAWYQTCIHILECAVGLLIGTELVWKRIKKSGCQIIVTTLTQSLGTFALVTFVFAVVFYFMDIPLYLAAILGGIALATAPAPALSIVREFKTKGPVTNTLVPMAALDDMVGVIVFFTVISIVASNISEQKLPVYMIVLVVLLPIIIGALVGVVAGFVLKKESSVAATRSRLIATLLLASLVGLICNYLVLPKPMLNFMLIGMAFSTVFANMVSEERLNQIVDAINPLLGLSMIIVILNLGVPLDYHLILGAGVFTVIYIVVRALGKYAGSYVGSSITHAPKTVKTYLGLVLLPHSGVSLVFTGIAVGILTVPAPEAAKIIQGTIAAAAVINEIIAVIISKKAFEWAGELNQDNACNEEVVVDVHKTSATI